MKKKNKGDFNSQEQKQVDAFVKQIDITNSQMVLQYGASSQKKIADFSESALGNVRTKDLGEIGNELTAVVNELKSIETVTRKRASRTVQKAAIRSQI